MQGQQYINAHAQVSGQGSNHGSFQASASASGSVRTPGNRPGSGSGSQLRPNSGTPDGAAETSFSLSQSSTTSQNSNSNSNVNHNERDLVIPDPQPAAAAGAVGAPVPQQPPVGEDDTLRLVVSGHLGHPNQVDIAEGEARSRLIPWIGREVMATQRGQGNPISLRQMDYASGRIVIHPCSQEAGERLAEAIRTRMNSDNHPYGFSAEFNESLDPVAELTIRCPVMGNGAEVRGLIESVEGGLISLNIANGGWPAHLAGSVRYIRHWDEPNGGLRVIRFSATRGVVEAIMAPPHSGEAFIGYLMGTVKHDRLDVKPGTQINYKRPFAE